jgi:hypothetical protein
MVTMTVVVLCHSTPPRNGSVSRIGRSVRLNSRRGWHHLFQSRERAPTRRDRRPESSR